MASTANTLVSAIALYHDICAKSLYRKKDPCEVLLQFQDGYAAGKGQFADFLHITIDLFSGAMERPLKFLLLTFSDGRYYRVIGSDVYGYSRFPASRQGSVPDGR